MHPFINKFVIVFKSPGWTAHKSKKMKTLINGVMLLAFSVLGYIPSIPAACAFQHNFDVVSQLTTTLPSGIWETEKTQENQTTLHFYSSGELDWFTFASSEIATFESFRWEIQDHLNGPILYVSNHEKALSFELSGDCYYLQLDGQDEALSFGLNHKAAIPKKNQNAKLFQLQGNWENNSRPIAVNNSREKNNSSAYLKYRFMPNGQFEKRLSNNKSSLKKAGQWRLTKDGKHIIMRMNDGSVSVAMLKYLNMDELVLSHVYEHGPTSTAGEQDYFFNRN